MLTCKELQLNLHWIRLLSFLGVLPIKLNVKSSGNLESCGRGRQCLYLFYWALVQIQIIYFIWESYWKIRADPGNAIYVLSIYNLFVVASLVGTCSSFSYFILWPEDFSMIFNESRARCKSSTINTANDRELRKPGRSGRQIFTKFIPAIHVVSAVCSIIALAFVSWPAMCGPTPLLLCPAALVQGLSITIALAWCYTGVLIQILFMFKVNETLKRETSSAR